MIRHARCSCGQYQLACEGQPAKVSVCHCRECQRRTGSAYGAQVRYPLDKVTFTGVSKSWTRQGDSGGSVTFRFCETCGSTVHWTPDGMPQWVIIGLGAMPIV